jgi:hypothetical protein
LVLPLSCPYLLWPYVGGHLPLRSSAKRQRQVVACDIDSNCRTHENQSNPEAPIMVHALPVRRLIMMNVNAPMSFLLVMMIIFTFTHRVHVRKKSSAGMCRVAHEAHY